MMKDYIQVTFYLLQPGQIEILVALLSAAGYEGFEETGDSLRAFIPVEYFDDGALNETAHDYHLQFDKKRIPATNWNQLWESGFEPVFIDDFCTIRADFHTPFAKTKHEIIITPKQSFGTGHHSTTYMMMQQMQKTEFSGKSVLDFGTGTGVLAILAEKLGAAKITAIDNDDWSIENAKENIITNNCLAISLLKSDSIPATSRFDIILANINKSVIIGQLAAMVKQLSYGGVIMVSGLLQEDETEVLLAAGKHGLKITSRSLRSGWISLTLQN